MINWVRVFPVWEDRAVPGLIFREELQPVLQQGSSSTRVWLGFSSAYFLNKSSRCKLLLPGTLLHMFTDQA